MPTNPYRPNRSPPNPHRSNWTAADVRVQDRLDVTPPNPYRLNRLSPNPHQSNWTAKDDRVDDRQGNDRWHGVQVNNEPRMNTRERTQTEQHENAAGNDETTNAVIATDRTSTCDTTLMTPSQLRQAYPNLIIEEQVPQREQGQDFNEEFGAAFNKDEGYLMGLDGVESLQVYDLERIGFSDPKKAYRAFHMEHQMLMANWHTTTSRGKIVGPNQKQLLQDISLFTPLASTRQSDVIDFIAQFHDLIDSYNIAVMPFSMIEVKFGIVGLCIPGVGEMKYDRMRQALAKILYGHLIPNNIDKMGRLDQLLLNAKNRIPPNGYEMLHILLELYVDPFKPHMVDIKWPTFGSCWNIFDYAGQFNVIMQLYEKKGEKVEPRKAAIKFLEAVKKEGGVTYRAAALLLKTAILE